MTLDKATCAHELPAPAETPPAEVLLIPAGEVRTRPHDGRPSWHNNDAEGVVAASAELGSDLVIDYDHATEHAKANGTKAPAAGWIKSLFVRDGAVWGKVEWTAAAAKHLAEREFRFLSPSFHFDRATRAIKRVLGAGLTNDPAFYMKAVAQTQGAAMSPEELAKLAATLGMPEDSGFDAILDAVVALVDAAKAPAEGEGDAAMAAAAVKALGLAAGAKPADVAAAAARLAEGADPDPAKFVPIAVHRELAARVETLETGTASAKAEAAVAAAMEAGKITPAARDWALAYAKRDAAGFAEFVGLAPVVVAPGRRVAGAQPPDADAPLTAEERAVASATGISEDEFKASRKQLAARREEHAA